MFRALLACVANAFAETLPTRQLFCCFKIPSQKSSISLFIYQSIGFVFKEYRFISIPTIDARVSNNLLVFAFYQLAQRQVFVAEKTQPKILLNVSHRFRAAA